MEWPAGTEWLAPVTEWPAPGKNEGSDGRAASSPTDVLARGSAVAPVLEREQGSMLGSGAGRGSQLEPAPGTTVWPEAGSSRLAASNRIKAPRGSSLLAASMPRSAASLASREIGR